MKEFGGIEAIKPLCEKILSPALSENQTISQKQVILSSMSDALCAKLDPSNQLDEGVHFFLKANNCTKIHTYTF